ncbi:protein abrupt isoform X3 [Aethina tumida]|uniref:protein abrupt isoform X3 n=1 Tax=Aethina tumida TaxID=116153 RepID=UPI002149217E|nr:protein abrupt isoform X3 [Aethina tumida]
MGADTSPDQQYSLRWNDFHSSILSSFRHLRDEEDFVDVTLACDGCSFTAHKVVLSACSPYFRRLLKANPCQHPIVILRDVQQKDMESLLRFMYNGEVHIGQEHLTDFLKTAQMLQVRGLADVPAGAAGQRLTVPEKISPNSSSLPWATDRPDALREGGLSPPPAKRSRSADRPYTPDRVRSPSRGNGDMQESLLGQALEGGPTIHTKEKNNSDSSLQAQSTGEDSNSSDTAMSDHGHDVTPKTEPSDYPMLDDHHPYNTNGGLMDQNRSSFPGALLGLPGLGGLMPGPSGMHNSPDSFDASSLVRREEYSSEILFGLDHVGMKYECPLCEVNFTCRNLAVTHLDEHYPRDSPVCPVMECRKKFSHPNSVRNHMRSKHSRQWNLMKKVKWGSVLDIK